MVNKNPRVLVVDDDQTAEQANCDNKLSPELDATAMGVEAKLDPFSVYSKTVTQRTFRRKEGGEPMQAYCMKCRTKREMKDAKAITMKNGRPATQGACPVCGTKMFRIGKS